MIDSVALGAQFDGRRWWFQCPGTLFDEDFMVLLEHEENHEKLQLTWVKILCFCVSKAPFESQVGFIKLSPKVAMAERILATLLRVDLDHMRVAMKIFQEHELVRFLDDGTMSVAWIAGRVKRGPASSTLRSQKSRALKKAANIGPGNKLSATPAAGQRENVAMQLENAAVQHKKEEERQKTSDSQPPKGAGESDGSVEFSPQFVEEEVRSIMASLQQKPRGGPGKA